MHKLSISLMAILLTDYIEGDSIDITFTSRYVSNGNWGFIVEELQYVD